MDDVVVHRGSSQPFPSPELDLGNIVRLKEPWCEPDGRAFDCGIIVQHVSRNWMDIPKVSVHLFNSESGVLEKDDRGLIYHDLTANEFSIVVVASRVGRIISNGREVDTGRVNGDLGYFMYPRCPGCGDENQHPFQEDAESKCPQCGGWGL